MTIRNLQDGGISFRGKIYVSEWIEEPYDSDYVWTNGIRTNKAIVFP